MNSEFWDEQARQLANQEIAQHTAMASAAIGASGMKGQVLPIVVDAFTMQFTYGFRYAYSQMTQLSGLDNLRRAQGHYRPQYYTFPEEQYQVIDAYDTAEYQVNIPVGTFIWGVFCPRLTTGDLSSPSVQILIGQSQYPVFDRITKFRTNSGQPSEVTYCGIFNPPLIVTGSGPTAPVSVQVANGPTQERRYVILLAAVPRIPKAV